MKKLRARILVLTVLGMLGISALMVNFIVQATSVIQDTFADGISTNQNLAANSLAVYKARSGTIRTDAVGSVEYNMTAMGGADAIWSYFTNSGAPVTLQVGDAIAFSGTFSLTGVKSIGSDIRFGLLNSNGSRATADKTGGHSDGNFADDTGYGAQFVASGSGSPFVLYRKDASTTSNIFNSMATASGGVPTGWSVPLSGTGASARQPLVDNTPYTFTYSVKRNSATETQVTISVTGGVLSNLNYTAVENNPAPNTSFDWFAMRFAWNTATTPATPSFADKIKFTEFKVDFNPAAPTINTQPAPPSQTVSVGANVQYSVGATGSGLTYQWRKDNSPIIGNATAAAGTLQLNNVQTTDSGVYSVNVINAGGTTPSDPVTLTVSGSRTEIR
jgi:hypothetical protein